MPDKPIYSISSLGGCARTVSAARLGYEELRAAKFLEDAAAAGSAAEPVIADALREWGWWVSDAVSCEPCDREGEHVELEFPAFKFVGHVDRYAKQAGKYFAEFKALATSRAEPLMAALCSGTLEQDFYQYAAQISLYHYATGLPCLYAVQNRDTGVVRHTEYDKFIDIEELVERVLKIEVAALKGKLVDCTLDTQEFWYRNCRYKYLHDEEDETPPWEEADNDLPDREQVRAMLTAYLDAQARVSRAQAEMAELAKTLIPVGKKQGRLTETLADGRVATLSYTKPGTSKRLDRKKLEAKFGAEAVEECSTESSRTEYISVRGSEE